MINLLNMDKQKNSSPEEKIIKIILLDIFPSINEIKQQKDQMDIIFQGLDIFYNLFELITTKKEITLKSNNKSSIIISLIKSNNLFATCLFNLKQGEQWIKFSYENKKKKEMSLAQTLIDCIKIKVNCEITKSNNLNNNSIGSSKKFKRKFPHNSKLKHLSNNRDNNNIKSQSFIVPYLHKLNSGSKIQSNKGGEKRISLESSPKESKKTRFTWLRTNNSIISNRGSKDYNHEERIKNKKKNFFDKLNINNGEKSLRRMKTKNNYSKILDEDLAIRLNKMTNKKDETKLNLTQRSRKNTYSNGNLDYSIKNSKQNNNLTINNYVTNKIQKNKHILKNRFLNNKKAEIKNITNEYNNKKSETEISINNVNNLNDNNYELNINGRKKYKHKEERSHDEIDNLNIGQGISMTNRRNKDIIKDLKINTSTNAKTPEITRNYKKYMKSNKDKKTIDSEKLTVNDDKNKNKYSFIFKNISYDFSSDDDNYEDDEIKNKILDDSKNSDNENGNYSKLKEDFILLYNENYINNVQEDLLKLEIELFVEKMTGLISAYHYEINEKKLQNKILESKLKKNSEKYINLFKLYCRLNLVKKNYKRNYMRLLKNKLNIKEIDDINFELNKNELKIFKLIFPNKNKEKEIHKANIKDKNTELKNIINILLFKRKNKNIFMKTDLYKKWVEINKINENSTNLDINQAKDGERKYKKPITRARVIPKIQQTKFNSKINNCISEQNYNTFVSNENKSEKKINNKRIETNFNNYFTHNPDSEIYSKNSAAYPLYPRQFYSKKIPK